MKSTRDEVEPTEKKKIDKKSSLLFFIKTRKNIYR